MSGIKQFVKILFIIAGSLSLALGILGIILPLLPTTPFLLLSAVCYVRSSEKLYHWLINHKWFGPYIQSFRSGKGIPFKSKVIAITIIWLSFGFSAIFVVNLIVVKILFIILACFFTFILLRMKTDRQPRDKESHLHADKNQ